MAYNLVGINAIVKDMISRKIHSSFVQANPLLYFLAGPGIDNMGKLGQVGTPTVFGGKNMSQAQKVTRLGSKEHQFRYQIVQPAETQAVSFRGATPVSTLFAEDAFGTATTKWSHHDTPMRIGKHSLMMAKGGHAIGAVVEDAIGPVINSHLDAIQDQFWNGSRTLAEQTGTQVWENYLGVLQTINAGNTYASIDRVLHPEMNSLVLAGDGAIPTLSLIRQINVVNNMAVRSPTGQGIDLVVTTPAIWMMLATEAEGKWTINDTGIPHHAYTGFQYPVIRYDRTWITYDEDCPPGCMFLFHTPSWVYELSPDYNFTIDGKWVEKDLTEEGGGHYIWALLRTMGRLTCREPWLQARICGLAEETSESLSSSSSSQTETTSSSQSSSSPSTSELSTSTEAAARSTSSQSTSSSASESSSSFSNLSTTSVSSVGGRSTSSQSDVTSD